MNHDYPPSKLTECDREPIHHIAAVQSFGGLIAVNADWMIAHRSINCGEMLGLDDLPAEGDRLADHFLPGAIDALKDALLRQSGGDNVERISGLQLVRGGDLFDCAVHPSEGKVVIEFEPHAEEEYSDHLAMIGPILSRLEPIRELDQLCVKAAQLVREMLGYDRVMVYTLHTDESGEVIAENRREDLKPFLSLRFPRADIPQQARDLFRRNRCRIIADMEAEAVPIEPPCSMCGDPLDLSMSVLRSHSEMHAEYMRNMGVRASMTISIVRQGRLWGMISCHHTEPKLPPYSLRIVAEVFSQMFSLLLDKVLQDVIPHDSASVLMGENYHARGAPSGPETANDTGGGPGSRTSCEKRSSLPGHVLVVEDSMMIALDTEENLKRLGVESVQVESDVAGALASIADRVPDFAIIDFNLGSETSEPVAKELQAKGVRFVLATGYAELKDQIEQLGAIGLLRKPYGREEIEKLITAYAKETREFSQAQDG
ncbi:GAF domain-containing protein [Erythrobacter sp. MTPC3]|uniref:GAF domain-containing protein n=1 Tax=Erythrobacter sp. MTPC3 TaxID=3056564 RepID=UPI0036F2CA2F